MENANPLRILFVEDVPSDAILAERVIRKSGLEFTSERVDTKDAFLKALDDFRPDIIVSDYSMPEFDGMQALKLLLGLDARIPFILLTGSVNEETAAKCMKAGAWDYVIKEHMARLPFAVRDALEQKRIRLAKLDAERAMHESEERYRTLITFSPDAIYVHVDGHVTMANPAMCQLIGAHDPSQLIGKSVFQIVHPDYHEKVRERLSQISGGQTVPLLEEQFIRLDGTTVDVEVNAVVIDLAEHKEIQVVARNITERKRAEESRLLLTTAIEASARGVVITDLEGSIVWINKAFSTMTGYSRTEVLGKNPKFLNSGKQDGSFYKDLWKTISAGKVWSGELINKRKDGSLYSEEMIITPVNNQDNKVTHYVALKQDITERKRAEEALRASKAMIDRIINAIPVRVFWKDKNLTYLGCNAIFAHDAGYAGPEDVIGKDDYQMAWRDQAELYRGDDRNVIDSGSPRLQIEEPQTTPGGETITLLTSKLPLLDDRGEVSGVLGIYLDVTERKNAENSLRLSEERFRSVWDNSADGMRLTDREGRIIDVNPAFCTMFKKSREELLGKVFSVAYLSQGPDDDLSEYYRRFDAGETISNLFGSAKLWNGESIDLHVSSSYIETSEKQRILLGLFRDVTEQKKAEKRLEAERTLLRTIIDAFPDEICLKDTERRFILANPGTVRALKKSSEKEIVGKRDEDLIPERFALQAKEEEELVLATGNPSINRVGDSKINPSTGEIERSILISKIPLKDSSGKVVGLVGINRDITEVQRANASLEKERTLLLTLIESIPDEVCLKDLSHRYLIANSASMKALRVKSLSALIGKTDLDLVGHDFAQEHIAEESAILQSGEPLINRERTKIDPNTGEIEKCLLTTKVPVRDQTGKTIGILVINRYVTERRRAEEALRASEEKYRALFEESKDAVYISTADGKLLDVNAAALELFGYGSREEFLQTDLIGGYADPGEKERFDRQMEEQGFVKDFELVFKRADGKKLTVLETATAVRDKNGKIVQYRGIIRDITSQRRLEAQFLQAQKMESIGTLAGGIAHDFNNILGIVLGHLALLERTRTNDAQFEESIFSINKAVERGASLVRQILTFARKAETQLEPVNINSVIKELAKMLEETFPKTIAVTLRLDKTIPVVSMDPTQLHQTMLNLCVNARDAMEGKGTLTIVTHLVLGRDVSSRFPKASASHYVQMSVIDTGSGMDEETKQRIFEPFFTTKGEGKGTGLGLAVVYGVLQAHNGFVDVETALGHGTAFHLFFPVPEGIIATSEKQTGTQEHLARGTETILLVEDEDVLRDLLAKLLKMQGYKVISASDGEEAVRQFGEHADEIDLVLSDMGLPKRSGWDAFKMMQKVDPNVRALLASGYIEPGQKSEVLKSGVRRFISKPYRMEEVLKAVRETLDEQK